MEVHAKGDASAPTSGLFGQISFQRLVDLMRASGHIAGSEKVSDLIIDVKGGVIQYVIQTK